MDDLISKQAVSSWLKQYGQDVLHRKYKFSLMYIWKNLMDLPPEQPKQKWISCSERMPEEGQNCLVCDKGSIGIDTYIGHGNPYNWKWYVRDYEAWLPLPEPYKEGDTK